MLLLLAEYLQQFHKGFAVFQYLTLRGILGVLTAWRCRCGSARG